MKYVVYPDLPPLIDQSAIQLDNTPDIGRCATVTQGEHAITGLRNHRYALNFENYDWKKWVCENIADDYSSIVMSHHGPELETIANPVGTIIPHTDGIRDWGLLWLTDLGGENVETVFWQEQDQPIYRGRSIISPTVRGSNTKITTYNTLTELHRVNLPVGRWVLLNVGVIHSVENITSTRKALHINFENDSQFIKKWCS